MGPVSRSREIAALIASTDKFDSTWSALNATSYPLFVALLAVSGAAVLDVSLGSSSPFNPGWIAFAGWLALLIAIPLSFAAVAIGCLRPLRFWLSLYPIIVAIAALGIEFLWWTPAKTFGSTVSAAFGLAVAFAISRIGGWESLRWLAPACMVIPFALIATLAGTGERSLSPFVAMSTVLVGLAIRARMSGAAAAN
jgi:hypothetical protein